MAKHKPREDRRAAILDAAFNRAQVENYNDLTRDDIAICAGVSAGQVNAQFGTIQALRDAVVTRAIKERNAKIVADALAIRSPLVRGIDPQLKQLALANLL